MKLVWYLINFTKFYLNFQTNISFCNYTRKENTVLNRLHVGHSYLTHSFIWRKDEAHVCFACNAVITVKHILIECGDLVEIRKKYFEERSLSSLFQNLLVSYLVLQAQSTTEDYIRANHFFRT